MDKKKGIAVLTSSIEKIVAAIGQFDRGECKIQDGGEVGPRPPPPRPRTRVAEPYVLVAS